MKVWHFTETPYPPAWDVNPDIVRSTLPSRHFDPKIGAELINQGLDQWALCDELGMNIMVNEHHNSSTSLNISCTLLLAILARQTQRARLLVLGVPIGVRNDPLLIAEELSYIDVLSRGRLEIGLVKGVATELPSFNVSPATQNSRFWEAHDLILKAMTSIDGPFSFEGEHFHYRHANVWPRPYQEPHPRIWMASFGPQSTIAAADRGYQVCAGFTIRGAKTIFDAYRARTVERGKPQPDVDRFGYLAGIAVGSSREEGLRRGREIKRFFETTVRAPEPFQNPPGFVPVEANVQWIRQGQKRARGTVTTPGGRTVGYATATVEDLIEGGTMFAGSPDDVFNQIKESNAYVGGYGHLLAMMGGALSQNETLDSMRLFAREVMPRLQELNAAEGTRSDLRAAG
jgi:alkanesulfonate monooxygenase SsuD/methylene tetrahydromethanopterin reductase-like flavin-dependent oxidoreductase (luciferase family)